MLKMLKERYGFKKNYDFTYSVYFFGDLILCNGLD